MTFICLDWVPDELISRTRVLRIAGLIGLVFLLLTAIGACAQSGDVPKGVVKDGYTIHQTTELGGHIAEQAGSAAMYDTLVNLQTGPRVLGQTYEMHALPGTKHPLFDTLFAASNGYGGDPNNFVTLRISKGKLYDFQGLFRRDRQYMDYDLFDNPLVPAGVTSNGYTFPQVENSPHLFNTVRRMTDVNLTLLPLSKVSFRAGYSQNLSEGPSYSSIHMGTEAQLLQNWRNNTDSWTGAVDWKPIARTQLTFEEHISHYKGDTNWRLAGLNLQLSNGTPVSIGFDNTSVPSCTGGAPIVSSITTPATANAGCNGYLQYSRDEPTRTLFPTEEFRFQSASIKNIRMNGLIRYTGANMNLPNYSEYFSGLESRTTLRAATTTGYSTAKRVNVSADYGFVWQVTGKFSLSDQYDFWDFRQPAYNSLSEVDQSGASMLAAPGAPQAPAVTSASAFLGQKTETNTVTAAWQASPEASISLGYRYRSRAIDRSSTAVTDALPNGTAYTLDIHENGGILGFTLRPTPRWRVNGGIEASYADKTYTQISPRALQHYQVRASYKPKDWATISGAFNDLERRNNVQYVDHLDHSRSVTFGASLMPNVHYGVELNYGYVDFFSRTDLCYTATPVPSGAVGVPSGTGCGTNTYLGNGYYDAPTQYGAIGITLAPVTKLRSSVGYRMSAISGTTEFLNPRQVSGSLQSQYQSPYANVAWTVHPGWIWRGDWNYYGYGEGGPIGPTSPRAFHSNVVTLGMHYEF
ncbi:hypothetical protein [Granulicella sp. 5B5]|uniref:hypothetical protein n=1 Tax=Granulicella sp. 5B5 TaxID=1617967 RepID=UPI0015F40B4A|nr:hypothetical protein [Granulicella sp. 5B5]